MQPQLSIPLRSTGSTYLWWFFLGTFGAHKFYLGRPLVGVLYACTLGFLWIGVLLDLFTIPAQVRQANERMVREASRLSIGDSGATPSAPAAAPSRTTLRPLAVTCGIAFCALIVIGAMGGNGKSARATRTAPATVGTDSTSTTVSRGQQLTADLFGLGFEDGLSGRGWSASRSGPGWLAIAHRRHGENEVSALLEGDSRDGPVQVELAAELYDPRTPAPVLDDLARTAAALDPQAPAELAGAIRQQQAGSFGAWRVVRESYPTGGFEVRASRSF